MKKIWIENFQKKKKPTYCQINNSLKLRAKPKNEIYKKIIRLI